MEETSASFEATLLVNEQDKILFRHLGYESGQEEIIEAEIRQMLGLEPFQGNQPG